MRHEASLVSLSCHRLLGMVANGGGQLGYMLAIADSRFNPFLDQPLLQFDELRRVFHCEQCSLPLLSR